MSILRPRRPPAPPEPSPSPDPLRQRGAEFWDQVVDGAFGHGYAVHLTAAAGLSLPDLLSSWPVQHLDGWTYRVHPRAVLTSAADRAERRIVLIGHPLDVAEGIADPEVIARRLLQTLGSAGPEAVVREAAYLGGRWTLFVQHRPARRGRRAAARRGRTPRGSSLWVVADAHASQPVFYAATGPEAVLASSGALVGQLLGLPPSAEAPDLMAQAKELRPRNSRYLPGTVTDVDGVLPLVPNCLLEVDLDGDPSRRSVAGTAGSGRGPSAPPRPTWTPHTRTSGIG